MTKSKSNEHWHKVYCRLNEHCQKIVQDLRPRYPLLDYLLSTASYNLCGLACEWRTRKGTGRVLWSAIDCPVEELGDLEAAVRSVCRELRVQFFHCLDTCLRHSELRYRGPDFIKETISRSQWKRRRTAFARRGDVVIIHPNEVIPKDLVCDQGVVLLRDRQAAMGGAWRLADGAVQLCSIQDQLITLVRGDDACVAHVECYYAYAWPTFCALRVRWKPSNFELLDDNGRLPDKLDVKGSRSA